MLQDRSLTGQQETTIFAATGATTVLVPYVQNTRLFIPLNTAAAAVNNAFMTFGLLGGGAQAAVAIAVGDKVYWDSAASKFTNVAAGNTLCGAALEPSPANGPTGLFRFDSFAGG